MLRTRVMPALLLRGESLIKTVRFGKFTYIGDPCNTVRIFNELEVDELVFLDISATVEKRPPNLQLLADIANECFMPLTYGGGVRTVDDARRILGIGFEKIAINSHAVENPGLIEGLSSTFGSQAIIVSIDVRSTYMRKRQVVTHGGRCWTGLDPVEWARRAEALGAGEILLTSVNQEGSWNGFDYGLVKEVCSAVSVPVIAHGGAGAVEDIEKVVKGSGASAVALGSMVVFQKKGMGVLVNFPDRSMLERTLHAES
jgi:cyclase